MTDRAIPNLPSRDFEATSRFYAALGFVEGWRDSGWMILMRGTLTLEFFPYPDLNPWASSFGCCLRLDNVDAFFAVCVAANIAVASVGMPRLHAPVDEPWGRVGALIDLDGTLLRLIQS